MNELNVMREKDVSYIVDSIYSSNAVLACSAICVVCQRKLTSSEVVAALKAASKNTSAFWNQYNVSSFAYAALHLLGISSYKGNDESVYRLISSNLEL